MSDCLRKMMAAEFDKAIKEDKVEAAEQELADYLKKHPKMIPYQDEIDELLRKTGPDPSKRLEVLALLMTGKMAELQKAWVDLFEMVHKLPV